MTWRGRAGSSGGWRRTRRLLALVAAAALVTGAWWWLAQRPGSAPMRAERQAYAPYSGPLRFPEGMVEATPPEVFELYEFAARRPDVMHYVPCFCGCWRIGHESAYDCFIDEVRPDGTVDIDDMGFT